MSEHATSPEVPAGDAATITVGGELPDPRIQPTLDVPEAGRYLGLSRALSYNAAASGELPTIRFGRKIRVPTAAVRRMLALDGDTSAA